METKQKNYVIFRIVMPILLILWMYLIFTLSNQTATESSAVSGGLIASVVKFFLPNASVQMVENIVSSCQFFVRKGAHFSIYFVLGILSYLSFVTYKIPLITKFFFSNAIGLLYSATDEYHQTYIDGRSGELRDIIIDFSGVFAAVLISVLITTIIKKSKARREGKRMKKKEYVALTDTLQRELHKARITVDELKEDNEQLLMENSALEGELYELRKKLMNLETKSNIPAVKEAIVTDLQDIDVLTYGSRLIGKIVLLSAEFCNKIDDDNSNKTEIVNLILGRTEVAKSEILKILTLNLDEKGKISALDKEYFETEDYFKSVMAQK